MGRSLSYWRKSMNISFRTGAIIASLALTTSLVACSSDSGTTEPAPATQSAQESTAPAQAQEEGVTFTEGFMKAKPAAGEENGRNKTGIFGIFTNNTDEDIQITSFKATIEGNDKQPTRFELHEVVDGKMQEKKDGYTVPAGGTHELKPGHDHMMIMDYDDPILPGVNTVDLEISLSNGDTLTIDELPVRDLNAGNESYAPAPSN